MKNGHTSVVRMNPHNRMHKGGRSNEVNSGARRRLAIWLAVCTIFVAWAGLQLFHQTGKIAAKRSELEQAEQKLQQTVTMKQELLTKIERLHDPEYVAELARKEYYMTREGEIIFVDPK